jgi:hypothetical protein
MKKTISGVLLTLTAAFALFACGKKERKRNGKPNQINFYCWNDEFKTRLNKFYGIKSENGSTTTLNNGIVIQWTMATNEGSVYQDTLDIALDNNMVDMYCFEADYATKYVKSEFAIEMEKLGILGDMKNQYKYTQDIVTNADGKIVGSSWQATPGIIVYNYNVAKAVWSGISEEAVEEKLSTWDKFQAAAADVKKVDGKYTLIGYACWYRTYGNNLSAQMYDAKKKTITVDKALFDYAKDTRAFADAGYICGTDDDFGLWQGKWNAEMGKDNCLCIFSCPWYTDFCLTGNRVPQYASDADKEKGYAYAKDSGLRLAAGYKTWFWGGTWLTATPVSQQEETIKGEVANIIKKMTTDKETLLNISKTYSDFTNDKGAMTDLAADATAKNGYFGGQNAYAYYAAAVEKCDLSKASDYDQQITEGFQAAFVKYIRGEKDAAACWEEFKAELTKKTSISKINYAANDLVK